MATGSRGRPKGDSNRDLRHDLLRVSRELLDEGGPGALSLREVARRTGCTHQAPYHYFEDRETILAALVIEGFETLAARLKAANDAAETDGQRAALLAAGRAYVEFAVSHPGVFRVMFRPDACNPARFPRLQEAGLKAKAELTRLSVIVSENAAEAEVLETLLWAHVHGLASLILDGPLSTSRRSARELDIHLDAVASRFADRILPAELGR